MPTDREQTPDQLLDAYADWLNEAMFEREKDFTEGERLTWLGTGRWLITVPGEPGTLLVEIKRAEVVANG